MVVPFFDDVQKIDVRVRSSYFQIPKIGYYLEWQIIDLSKYLKNIHQEFNTLPEALRDKIDIVFHEALTKDKTDDLNSLKADIDKEAQGFGILVSNIGFVKTTGKHEIDNDTLLHTKDAYIKLANQYQSSNKEASKTIISAADLEAENILQTAKTKALELKAEADSSVITLYNNAYKQDPEFYVWWKNLEVYKKNFGNGGILVLQPGGMFLKRLNNGDSALKNTTH